MPPEVNQGVFVRKERPLKNRKEALTAVIDTIRLLEHVEKLKDIQNRKQKNIRVLRVILNDCKADLKELEEFLPEVNEMMPKKKSAMLEMGAKDLERSYGVRHDVAKEMAKIKVDAKDIEEKYGIKYDVAKQMLEKNLDFKGYVEKFKNVDPVFIAHTLIEIPREINKAHRMDISKLNTDDIEFALTKLDKKEIKQNEVIGVLIRRLRDKTQVKATPKISKLEQEVQKIRDQIEKLNI